MKSLSLILRVDTIRLPTSIWALSPKTIPLGLIRKTCPLARMAPRIVEGSCPITLFRTAEAELGWTKWTSSPTSILKPFQLMIARSLA